MNSKLQLLSGSEIAQISGGHAGIAVAGALGVIWFTMGLPHVIMGFVEFYNYSAERWINGCENIDDKDHFAASICGLIKK